MQAVGQRAVAMSRLMHLPAAHRCRHELLEHLKPGARCTLPALNDDRTGQACQATDERAEESGEQAGDGIAYR
jgi:hypothetical protein